MVASALHRIAAVAALAVSLAAQAWAGPAEDQYAVAAGHYARGRWQFAADEFQVFLREHPSHSHAPRARFFSGEACMQLRQYEPALACYREFLAQPDESPDLVRQASFRIGEVAYQLRQLDDARTAFERFQTRYPDDRLNAYLFAYLGEIALQDGNASSATRQFELGLARYPNAALADDCRLGLGRALQAAGEDSRAIEQFKTLASATDRPLADDAQLCLGNLQSVRGEHLAAAATFAQFEELFATSPLADKAKLGRAWALFQLGEHEQSRAVFQTLIEHDQVRTEAHYGVALTCRAEQNWAAAAESLELAAGDDTHSLAAAIAYYRGEAELRQADWAAATRHFDDLLSRWLDSEFVDDAWLGKLQAGLGAGDHAAVDALTAEFHELCCDSSLAVDVDRVLAQSLITRKQYADAVAVLRSQTDEQSRSLADTYRLALAMQGAGQDEAALELLQTVLAAPSSPLLAEATVARATILKKLGRWSESLESLDEYLSSFPDGAQLARCSASRAICLARVNRFAEARAALESLRALDGADDLLPPTMLELADAARDTDQQSWALELYASLIEQYADSELVPAALLSAARLQDRLQRNDQSLALYERLLADHADQPQGDQALYEASWLLRELDRNAEADGLLLRLHDDWPRSPLWCDSTYRLAERAYQSKELERSRRLLAALDKSTAGVEISQHALHLLARIEAADGHWGEVPTPLNRLLEDYPETSLRLSAEYWIAESSYRQADYAAAAARFAALQSQVPRQRESWMVMIPLRHAQCLAKQQRWTEAQQAAAGVAEQFPGSHQQHEVEYLIGRCLAADAQFESARQAYLRCIRCPSGEKTETAAMAQWMIGEAYFHQKDFQAALREYLRVEILYAWPTWQAAALLQAGKCQEQLGNWTDAVDLYSRLLKEHAQTEFADEATSRLKAAEQRVGMKRSSSKNKQR